MKAVWTTKIKLNTSGVAVMSANAGYYKLFFFDPKTKKYRQFFVGQALNLKRELALHLPWRERNEELAYYMKNYKCYFSVQELGRASKEVEVKSAARFLKSFMPFQKQTVIYR